MEPKSFIERLMDLITVEANNGDYYIDGYVPAYQLEKLINEFYPEYEFKAENTYTSWRPRDPNVKTNSLIPNIYRDQVIEQLKEVPTLLKVTDNTLPVGERIKFIVKDSKTERFIKDKADKKDEQS